MGNGDGAPGGAVVRGLQRKTRDQAAVAMADGQLGDLQGAVLVEGVQHAPLVEEPERGRVQEVAARAVDLTADLFDQEGGNAARAAQRIGQRAAGDRAAGNDDVSVHLETPGKHPLARRSGRGLG